MNNFVSSLQPITDLTWRELVAQHRLHRGLTKDELAKRCIGVSRTTLWRIESGKQEPTLAQMAAIEQAILTYVKPESEAAA